MYSKSWTVFLESRWHFGGGSVSVMVEVDVVVVSVAVSVEVAVSVAVSVVVDVVVEVGGGDHSRTYLL